MIRHQLMLKLLVSCNDAELLLMAAGTDLMRAKLRPIARETGNYSDLNSADATADAVNRALIIRHPELTAHVDKQRSEGGYDSITQMLLHVCPQLGIGQTAACDPAAAAA